MKQILVFCLVCATITASAQKGYTPAPENLEAREWFRDAGFGLFIHWGVYSVLAGGGEKGVAECVMENNKIPVKHYERLPKFFNPQAFDPAEWVSLAKDAGMKYITITSKHHDGFAMYDSEVSDYNIVDATPYGKDVLKALKEECDRQGIRLFFYYSQLDWHHPDYYPRGRTGQGYTGRPDSGDWYNYLDYMDAQLEELLTNYGEIGGIWFDGMWDNKDADWRLEKTYPMIHRLQPQVLIGSNHHRAPFPGEDFQMFERDLPGQNTAGFNQTETISDLPLEACQTIGRAWGYNLRDTDTKSVEELIRFLVRSAGNDANLLLNVGPMPNGEIMPENVEVLKKMGRWMDRYGETIYGTRGGPVPQREWGVTTYKEDKVYLHVLDWQDPVLVVPDMGFRIKGARYFEDGSEVTFRKVTGGWLIHLPEEEEELTDRIIVLER